MEYRRIGKPDMMAGVIGLGGEHLDGKPYETVEEIIHTALDGGVTLMDLFMPGDTVRKNVGKALGSRRKEMMIQGHIGSCDLKEQYEVSRDLEVCKRYFEKLLLNLKTDYIDFGMLFFMDNESALQKAEKNGIIDYALDLKRQGVIRAIGASAHNPGAAGKLVDTGILDIILFSVNPVFDMTPCELDVLAKFDEDFGGYSTVNFDPVRTDFYKKCARRNVSISVMKTLAAGKLLDAKQSPFAKPMSVGQCIHYALGRPAVASVLIGAANRGQMEEALRYIHLTDEEKDYTPMIQQARSDFKGKCLYCSHCQPCPAAIDIAAVHRCLDIARLSPSNIPKKVLEDYEQLAAHGGDCLSCGNCEEKCPFSVSIMKNMDCAKELFGA